MVSPTEAGAGGGCGYTQGAGGNGGGLLKVTVGGTLTNDGIISVNGAAAHKASPGDRIIICTYAVLSQQEASVFKPTLVYLDAANRIKDSRNAIPVQVA